jgi:hypothetical protein
MGLSDGLFKQLETPLNKLADYKDNEIPKLQKDSAEGKPLPADLPKKIKELKKIKEVADKLGPALRAISNSIKAIEVTKKIAEAAGDAGKIGGALVPPVAAAGVLQDRIITKVKEEIAEAKAQIPGVFALREELLDMVKKILIALLALVAANAFFGGNKSKTGVPSSEGKNPNDPDGDSSNLLSGMGELLSQIEDAEKNGEDSKDDGGLQKLVRETTATGTSESVQTSGGGSSSGGY